MIQSIDLELPMPPSANRYWRNYRGRTVVSDEARAYKEQIGWTLTAKGIRPLDGELVVTIRVYRERKSGDLDNRIKVVLDALRGHAYQDDSQVTQIHAYRYDDKHNPRVEINIERDEV